MREYRIEEGSVHEQFLNSRAKIQIFGGGFGNGKTAAACVKAIGLIEDYPGCNGLIARATFPKLNDTIRREFKLWCPPSMINSFPESKNSDNTAKFKSGSHINFRYISQQGKALEQSTSNLLSATYDFVIVDQMEDPEITEKDFYDLLGRLRGNTIYRGTDPTMPKSGPRFMILTVNPTGNWFYKRIVRPIEIYKKTGKITPELLCERDEHGREILIEGKPIMLVELFEAPTYANKRNLGADFIKTLESTYRGQMRDRFLLGKWASYEGLIYPEFSDVANVVTHSDMMDYMDSLGDQNYHFNWLEGYDFGIASPSCYLAGFVDPNGGVHVIDGYHEKEYPVKKQVQHIHEIRARYGIPDRDIFGDPSIFRRTSPTARTVGKSTVDLFWEEGKIKFRRGNNDIMNGILKIKAYLTPQQHMPNPYNGDIGAPMMWVSDKLPFISDEASAYMWKKNPNGDAIDEPVDKDDHSMDTLKYMMSERPQVGKILIDLAKTPSYMKWQESNSDAEPRYARYGN